MSIHVLIAHAEGEEALAERLAVPIRAAGYDVSHRGTVIVGESFNEEASKALQTGGPVVLCGTVRALGTGWAHRLVNAARRTHGARVFVVQMEEAAYVEQLSLDTAIARYWQDEAQAERDLVNALKKSFPDGNASLTLVHDAEQRYRELALAYSDIIDLANLPENDRHVATRHIELRRLYVPLRVRVEIASGVEARTAHIEAIERKERSLRGPFSDLSGGTALEVADDLRSRVSIGHRLASAKRIVVLGDAGSGKTTLLRWLATAYLLRLREDTELRNLPDVATLPYNDWLPVIVRCRDLDESSLTGSLENLLRYTLRKAELREPEVDTLRASIINRLTQGQALLLVDGLDEITDTSLRAKFCKQLEKIQIAYPNAPIVVTSRTVGYREMGDPLGRGFEHVTVAELTKDDKDSFARRWCLLTERVERQAEATAELIHDIHSTDRIERLTRNPMLLTTMALVKRKVGRLPSRRADLYWDALEVLLNWRREVDQPIDQREALPQLQYVAFAMCERGVQQVRQDELLDILHRMRGEYPQIHSLQRHSPEEFLTILERRTGIIVEAGHVRHRGRSVPVYEFRHLTFQEYLAGLALVDGKFPNRDRLKSLAESVSPLAGRVRERLPKQAEGSGPSENWAEPLRLCVAVCSDDDVDDVLRAILFPTDEKDHSTRSRAILAALCLADEPNVSNEVAVEILSTLISEITVEDGSGPVKTGIDVAIRELSGSAWASDTADMLIRQFVKMPEPPRSAIGSLYGAITEASTDADFRQRLAGLCELLTSEDQIVSSGAALTIMHLAYRNRIDLLPDMVPKLMRMLDKTVATADAASWALRWLNNPRTKNRWRPGRELKRFVELVNDPSTDPQVARNLILILGEEREPDAVPILIEKINSQDKTIEEAAITGLGQIADPSSAPHLIEKLKSADANIRAAIVNALGELQSADALEALLQEVLDEEEIVRANSIQALNKFNGDAVTNALLAALKDSSTLIRLVAVLTLGKRRERAAVEPLIGLLQDESAAVQGYAAEALGRIGDANAATYLVEKIGDNDPSLRAAAIRGLGHMNSIHLVEPIASALRDDSSEVRSAAELMLLKMALHQFNSNNLSVAIDIFSRMVASKPSEDYRNNLAYSLIVAGRHEEATHHYDQIDLSFSFNSALFRHNRAVLFALMGEPDKSIQYLRESLSMLTDNTEYDPRDVACMLLLDSVGQVQSVTGIPMDVAAIINLHVVGGLSQEDAAAWLLTRYPREGEQWLYLLPPQTTH
jgi:HEAT repeat protein